LISEALAVKELTGAEGDRESAEWPEPGLPGLLTGRCSFGPVSTTGYGGCKAKLIVARDDSLAIAHRISPLS